MIQAIEIRDDVPWVCIDGVFVEASSVELIREQAAMVVAANGPAAEVSDATRLAWRKSERAAAVAAIVVTTASGRAFDGDEDSQQRMSRALTVAQITGQIEATWVLANNEPTLITLVELQEALMLAMQAQARLWTVPYEK